MTRTDRPLSAVDKKVLELLEETREQYEAYLRSAEVAEIAGSITPDNHEINIVKRVPLGIHIVSE